MGFFYTLTPMVKQAEWYPAVDVRRSPRAKKHNAPKLRAGLEPGRVLVLLSGRFRGKRVVFLKRLDSGMLLVTGPHKVNGVPVKRVNQGFKACARFGAEKAANQVSADRVAIQKSIDSAIMANLKKTAAKGPAAVQVASYLAARFSLSKNDKPHAMKF